MISNSYVSLPEGKWGDELLFRFFWGVAQRKQRIASNELRPDGPSRATNLAEHVAESFEKSLKVVQLWPWLLPSGKLTVCYGKSPFLMENPL